MSPLVQFGPLAITTTTSMYPKCTLVKFDVSEINLCTVDNNSTKISVDENQNSEGANWRMTTMHMRITEEADQQSTYTNTQLFRSDPHH